MSKVKFLRFGDLIRFVEEDSSLEKDLDTDKIYNLSFDKDIGYFLSTKSEGFIANDTYGNMQIYLDKLKASFEIIKGTKESLSALFYGEPGTGKTYTMKYVALNLSKFFKFPIITITSQLAISDKLLNIIESLPGPVIFMIDEFEKLFPSVKNDRDEEHEDSTDITSILALLDGVISNNHIWLFTSNESLNKYLSYRSRRVKYVFNFNNLDESVVNKFIDLNLKDKNNLNKVNYILKIYRLFHEGINFDNLKTIVDEINLFGDLSMKDLSDLNLHLKDDSSMYVRSIIIDGVEYYNKFMLDCQTSEVTIDVGSFLNDDYLLRLSQSLSDNNFGIVFLYKDGVVYRLSPSSFLDIKDIDIENNLIKIKLNNIKLFYVYKKENYELVPLVKEDIENVFGDKKITIVLSKLKNNIKVATTKEVYEF